MSIFLMGLFVFFGVHCISIFNDPWRNRMVTKLGEWPWKGFYSLVSAGGFILMVLGFEAVHYDSSLLYSPPMWLQQTSILLFLPVFPLLIAAYFPGRIKTVIKHPMLLATQLWAVAHLFSRGSLADVILFGSFLVWAVVDRLSITSRNPRSVPGAPYSKFNDIIACVVGLGLFLVFVFWLHEILFGIPIYTEWYVMPLLKMAQVQVV